VSRVEFRVEGGIPCRVGNSVSRGKFPIEGGIPCRGGVPCQGGIPCRGGNSVSRGEFRDEGGIVYTQLYILLKQTLKSVFTINIGVFHKCCSGLP
jgi:hypothetical protein